MVEEISPTKKEVHRRAIRNAGQEFTSQLEEMQSASIEQMVERVHDEKSLNNSDEEERDGRRVQFVENADGRRLWHFKKKTIMSALAKALQKKIAQMTFNTKKI